MERALAAKGSNEKNNSTEIPDA
jgi:hypothetical protein